MLVVADMVVVVLVVVEECISMAVAGWPSLPIHSHLATLEPYLSGWCFTDPTILRSVLRVNLVVKPPPQIIGDSYLLT